MSRVSLTIQALVLWSTYTVYTTVYRFLRTHSDVGIIWWSLRFRGFLWIWSYFFHFWISV